MENWTSTNQLQVANIKSEVEIKEAVQILSLANQPVATRLGLTSDNAPTNPAFITVELLKKQIAPDREFYMFSDKTGAVGTVAIERPPEYTGVYFIERLAVIPAKQKNGYGEEIMHFACDKIKKEGGRMASVAIINENTQLKNWYQRLGFLETGTKSFDHLPFTVCFMSKEL